MGNPAGAARMLRRILRTSLSNTATYANLGFALLRAGSPNEALKAMRRGLLIDPNHFDLTMGLIEATVTDGDLDRSFLEVAWLERLLLSNPDRRYSALSVGAKVADAVAWRYLGDRVHHGPFSGMTYLDHKLSLSKAGKLVGCYEAELHESVQALSRGSYDRQVHIGCAEGYYAIGFGRLNPQCPTIAVDIDPMARRAVGAAAKANCVELAIADQFETTQLGESTFVMCDCEGAEVDLLTQPGLDRRKIKAMIIETHPVMDGSAERSIRLQKLIEAFRETHSLQVVNSDGRVRDGNFPALQSMPPMLRPYVMFEGRGAPTPWLVGRRRDV